MALEDKIRELLEGKKTDADVLPAEDAVNVDLDEGKFNFDKKKDDDSKDAEDKDADPDADDDEDEDNDGDGKDSDEKSDKKKKDINDMKEEKIDHIAALTEGEDLSEEFKAKAAVILEAAIADGVSKELTRLEEENAQRLDEAVNAVREELVEDIDGFLTTVVEQWVEENEIALERGIKSEIVENFIDGLKTLFTEHYIEVPEEKLDILDEQADQIDELQRALDESIVTMSDLKLEVVSLTRSRIMESVGDSLTDTEFEKFSTLCEGLTYETPETFEEKVKTIKESHFQVGKPRSVIAEQDTPIAPKDSIEGPMKQYIEALSNPLTFKRQS